MSVSTDPVRALITGVVLAGGRATRMGGVDKGLVQLGGRDMVAYVLDTLRRQVNTLMININRNHEAYRSYGCELVADGDSEFRGPLAGMASAMRASQTPYLVTVPCDSPLVCDDLVHRLWAARAANDAAIAVAHDGHRLQPVFALLACRLLVDLDAYLKGGGRKIDRWYDTHGYAVADCSDVAATFSNVNNPADRMAMEAVLESKSRRSQEAPR